MISDEQLEAMLARCDAAMPSPWVVYDDEWNNRLSIKAGDRWVSGDVGYDGDSERVATADFIANARADLPAVIRELERVRELIAEWCAVDNDRTPDERRIAGKCLHAYNKAASNSDKCLPNACESEQSR